MATDDGSAVAWGDPVASGRDRSLAARLARGIESGADEIEPACPHLAAVRAWLSADGDRSDVRDLLADVAALDALTYDEHRAAIAKAAGIRMSALDAERERLRPTNGADDDRQGAALALADPELWPHRVDGAELLAELARTIVRFVALVEGAATAVALWVVFAHAHAAAQISPLLAPFSPEKRCGKTTLLSVLTRLVPRPLPAANISAAALFRAVEAFKPTLLIDEADTIFAGGDDRCAELRGVLNSGHTRATAYTIRCVGDDHAAQPFNTWAPKVIALIGRLPDTLEDRSILVPMRRRAPGDEIERLRLDRLDELEPTLRKAARWAADNLEALTVADPDVPAGLHDRAADNWRPLLAIADRAGGDWPERARRAAVLLSAAGGDDDGSVRTLLLADLRDVMGDAERMASADIVAALVEMEHRPWPEWRRGNPLTARGMARLLDPFGVRPRQMKLAGQKVRGYDRADLVDAWARYLAADTLSPPGPPGTSGTPVQPAPGLGLPGIASGTPSGKVPDAIPPKPAPALEGTGVPDRTPPDGQGEEADDDDDPEVLL